MGSTTVAGAPHPQGTSDGSPFLAPAAAAPSARYAYSPDEPVLVGTGSEREGPANSRLYLNALRGPHGEVITYRRRGSCCAFETPSAGVGVGLLDVYELSYPGLATPLVVYLNMYDRGEAYVPRGLTARR